MFSELSLLERLARPKGRVRSAVENTAELTRSILRNLQNILNSRTGNAPAQMDLGTPAPSDIVGASPNAVALVISALRECIGKYEPRLAELDIAHIETEDGSLTLRFQISARIATSKHGSSISFDTLVDSAGRIRLQG